jgi:hypothetical protein
MSNPHGRVGLVPQLHRADEIGRLDLQQHKEAEMTEVPPPAPKYSKGKTGIPPR